MGCTMLLWFNPVMSAIGSGFAEVQRRGTVFGTLLASLYGIAQLHLDQRELQPYIYFLDRYIKYRLYQLE